MKVINRTIPELIAELEQLKQRYSDLEISDLSIRENLTCIIKGVDPDEILITNLEINKKRVLTWYEIFYEIGKLKNS
jgi:hypothetical protein